jgi:hypothetical protein
LVGETRKVVGQKRPAIEALAQRLLVKGTVNFLEIKARAPLAEGEGMVAQHYAFDRARVEKLAEMEGCAIGRSVCRAV